MMITQPDVPFSLDDITSEWLTMALREGGLIEGEKVVHFSPTIIGEETGFLGEVAILALEYSESTSAPASVVLKIPTALKNRIMGQTMGVYEKEIRFYRDLKPTMNLRSPRHYYSALDVADDPDVILERLIKLNNMPMWLIAFLSLFLGLIISFMPRRYVLLIEDLSRYRLGDQAAGCSEEDTLRVLTTMAKLHSQFWNSEELGNMSWIAPVSTTSKIIQMMFLQSVGKYKKANKGKLSERQTQLVDWLKENGVSLTKIQGGELPTLLHGDFRLDNICFDDESGEVLLFDWQTMLSGPAGMDLAYFLSAALPEGTTEEKINELIAFYHKELKSHGVEISSARLRWQYEIGMLAMLHRILPTLNQERLDLGSDRGPQLMQAWVDKTFSKLENVQFETILDRIPE